MWGQRQITFLHRICVLLCAALTLLVVLGGSIVVITERIRFYEEATILSTSAAFLHGQLLYVPADASAEYSLLYGPITFFAYLPPLMTGAQRLQTYEVWSLLALALTLVLVFLTFRTRFSLSVSFGSTALVAAIVSRMTANVWAIKADVWILMFSALGIFVACQLRPRVAAIIISLCGALLVDLKITLFLIALLPCLLLGQRERTSRLPAILSAIAIPLFALLPFALPHVSLRSYAALLIEYRGRSTSTAMIHINAIITLLILLPTLTLVWAAWKTQREATQTYLRFRFLYILLLLAACVVAVVSGAKVGGGPWHCIVLVLPCLPLNADLWRIASSAGKRAFFFATTRSAPILAVCAALFITAWTSLAAGIKERLHDPPGDTPVSMRDVEDDLIAISRQYPHTVLQMGYSDRAHYNLTFVRSILQIRGNPLIIDGNARNEADLIHRSISPAILSAVAECKVQLWIIPKGGAPFSMASPYYLDPAADRSQMSPDLYSETFRKTFLAHNRRVPEVSRYFDLWKCEP
jgi:hypothetical protein